MEKCLTEVDVDIDENYRNEILGRNPSISYSDFVIYTL